MKAFHRLILPTLLILAGSSLLAETTTPETAWNNETGQITEGSRYIFDSRTIPPDFLSKLSLGATDEDDPFETTSQTLSARTHPPILPHGQVPLCLPEGDSYYDISKLLNESGLVIKAPEWALLSEGLTGNNKLYFCTTFKNADIINQLFSPGLSLPRLAITRTTMISVKNQGLKNIAWTSQQLATMDPIIHAQYGTFTRSGEKSSLSLDSTNPPALGQTEYEITIGEDNQHYSCSLALSFQLLGETPVKIHLETAITGKFATPLIIDCGTHGNDHRNYLLVLESKISTTENNPSQPYTSIKRLDKIDGLYALRSGKIDTSKNHPDATKPAPLETHSYRSPSHFMENLYDRAFISKQSTPILVSNFTPPPHHQITDKVFDITPQLKVHGLTLQKNAWVYFNATQNILIIRAPKHTHQSVLVFLDSLIPTIRMVRINARIVSVDLKGMENPTWSIPEIEKRKPTQLSLFSLTGRSGEKSTSGRVVKTSVMKDPKTGKETSNHTYEFEIEPTICESSQLIYGWVSIYTHPLGPQKTTIAIFSTAILPDGSPTIIELGNPDIDPSAQRTHLLILNADLIRPDGSFYRDRLKPLP